MATTIRDRLKAIFDERRHVGGTKLPPTSSSNDALLTALFDVTTSPHGQSSAFQELRRHLNVQPDFQEKNAVFCAQYKSEGRQKLKHESFAEAEQLFSKALRHCVMTSSRAAE